VALLPDGKLITLASATAIGDGSYWQGLVRLDWDGSLGRRYDSSPVTSGTDFYLRTFAVLPDGKVLLGGELYAPGHGSSRGLIRFNADGTLDPSFDAACGYDVLTIAVQPDGKILIGGSIPCLGDWYGLARLNADGSLDPSFALRRQEVWEIALQPDDKILVAGGEAGVIRLLPDGTLDSSLEVNAPRVYSVSVQPDGRLFIAGSFTTVNGYPMLGFARLNNDLKIPVPFVQRDVTSPLYIPTGSTYEIMLYAHPVSGVTVYAVEDRVPPGWAVSEITFDGVFDAAAGKVKFGPFFDDDWRTLSYEVKPTPGATNAQCFEGVGSADGVNTRITGRSCMVPSVPHPADTLQPTWSITIDEATAYGAAWRRGESWPRPPVPIPIDYVTRAGALWRSGECYQVDIDVGSAPLWWISCAQMNQPVALTFAAAASATVAKRQAPTAFVPEEPVAVTIAVTPSPSARAYAIEEQTPSGWTVSAISHGGEFDATSSRVKWGPFFDNAPRMLTYRATPPPTAGSLASFTGAASFDGASQAIAGACTLPEGCRLTVSAGRLAGQVELSLGGRHGARFLIEASSDLITWTVLEEVTAGAAPVLVKDPAAAGFPQRFYRGREAR
jgi:uncharacterized delta-60 repeat protein